MALGAAACSGPAPARRPLASPSSTSVPTSPVRAPAPTTLPGAGPTVPEVTAAPTTASATTVTTAAPAAQTGNPPSGLAALERSLGPHDAASPVSSPATFAAVAHATVPPSGPLAGVPTLVNVYRWDGSAWQRVATDLGSGASLNPQAGFTVTTASLTGGPEPDFVVAGGLGASSSGLFVVADVSGRWEAVPVDHPGGGVVFVDGRVAGNEVQESVEGCNPNCASGRVTTTAYRFSAATGRFEPTGAAKVAG